MNDMNVMRSGDRPDDERRVQVSALVDGELDDVTVERAIDALLASDELAEFWADAHRAGDWMRSDEVIGVGDGAVFLRRFSAQLALEPTVLAPQGSSRSRRRGFWIKTGLPSASVAAALVVVAWVAVPFGRSDDAGKAANATPTVVIAAAPGNGVQAVETSATLKVLDADRFSDYLGAHRDVTPFRYGGASAVQASYTSPGVDGSAPPR